MLLILLAGIAVACGGSGGLESAVTEAPNADPPATTSAEAQLQTAAGQPVLGVFDPRSLLRRIYVLVEPGWSEARLTSLMDDLRAEADADPANDAVEGVEHYVMDDDSQFDTLFAELPRTEQGDTSNWPADYVTDHTVAYSKLFLLPDGSGGIDRAYILCFDLEVGCDTDNPPARYDQ
jgi:hypothetical protein